MGDISLILRAQIDRILRQVEELHDTGAWIALGYNSWEEFRDAELGPALRLVELLKQE